MMRVVVAFAVLALATAENSMSTMPLFRWSAHRHIDSEAKSADQALAAVLGSGKTEIAMVYMLNEASTHFMQNRKAEFTHLEDALGKARSSQFTALPVAEAQTESLLATARVNGVQGVEVEGSKLQDYLAAHPELATNGKADVIVVKFAKDTDVATADSILGSAEKAVAATTNGAYDSILSTTSTLEPGTNVNLAFQFFASESLVSGVRYTYNNGTSPTSTRTSINYGSAVNLTPTLLLSVLLMLYMVFLALSAFCCILALQTPEKFEGDQQQEMKRALNNENK